MKSLLVRCQLVPLALALGCQAGGVADRPVVERGTTSAPDGLEIVYDVRGAGEPTLVFVHGWACDRGFWVKQLDALATDRRVVAVDLGGHGESGKRREDGSIATLAGDVVAVADALRLESIVLVGHSLGGPVALEVAARRPGRVRAVVGVDTLHDAEHRYTEAEIQPQLAAFESRFTATMTAAVRGMFTPAADPEVVEWTVARARGVDQEAVLAIVRALPGYDPGAALRAAGVPVRCINAAPQAPMYLETKLETNRRYADFDVVLMEGVGHFPMLEAHERFNRHLRDVLADLAQAPETP